MRNHLVLLAMLPLCLAACLDESVQTRGSAESTDPYDPGPTDPPIHVGPQIRGLTWTWHGCGPSASPLPFSMTVHVDVLSSDTAVAIKGQAVGCDSFHGNDQTIVCTGSPDAIVRSLTVAVADNTGSDTQSAGTSDCVDGKAQYLP